MTSPDNHAARSSPVHQPEADQPEADQPGVAESSPPQPNTWAFWRRRLARGLIVGGLALAVLRLAPEVPREQHVIIEAPPGANITALNLSWRSQDDERVVGGVELRPHGETHRLSHLIKVPNGDYTLAVSARVARPAIAHSAARPPSAAPTPRDEDRDEDRDPPDLLVLERTVSLEGDTTRLTLTDR